MSIKQAPGALSLRTRRIISSCILTMEWVSENAEQALFLTRHVPQSKPRPGLPDSYGNSRVHLPLPQDRSAGFRHVVPRLHPRQKMRGAEKPEALRVVVSRSGRIP